MVITDAEQKKISNGDIISNLILCVGGPDKQLVAVIPEACLYGVFF